MRSALPAYLTVLSPATYHARVSDAWRLSNGDKNSLLFAAIRFARSRVVFGGVTKTIPCQGSEHSQPLWDSLNDTAVQISVSDYRNSNDFCLTMDK